MWDDEATTRGDDVRSLSWNEFRDARRRFLGRLEKQTQLLLLERVWEMPPARRDARRPGVAGDDR